MYKSFFITVIALILLEITTILYAEEVKKLPGWNKKLNFKHYSGYLQASETNFLHYWLVESESNPRKDPFVVWLNGGPGCSSLGGMLSENGPFWIKDDGKTVYLNKYAWNKEFNVLFLESPAGVGYSYSTQGNNAEALKTGDQKTAVESYAALKDFFTKFPQYRDLDLYITGESYGGVYVPMLVSQIINGQKEFPLNLKGMAIGNGLLSNDINEDTSVRFAYSHGLIDQNLWEVLETSCCGGCGEYCPFHAVNSSFCVKNVVDILMMTWSDFGLNVYDLYRDCYHPQARALDTPRFRADLRGVAPKKVLSLLEKGSILDLKRTQHRERKHGRKEADHSDTNDGVPICLNGTNYVSYLRQQSVREALYIPSFVPKFMDCSDIIEEVYQKEVEDVTPYIREALDAKVKILLYYGDTDMMCNFMMGEQFSAKLNLPLLKFKSPWMYKDQIAGFVTRYRGLDFLTVKGAGHMVPEWKAPESLKMIQSFINDQPY